MVINPRIFAQQNNIYKNRGNRVALPYSDESIFYKLLDKKVESGFTITITFPGQKLEEDSGLHKRLASCANGKELFDKLSDLARTAFDAYRHFATRNVFGLWKLVSDMDLQTLFKAYNVEYSFEESTGSYSLLLTPNGEGSKSMAWIGYL